MSDVSGSAVASEGSSYLTGYPLQEASMYALARTWPAPEMTRPGCVWTHTLFIEFPDLATVSSPSRLNELFARPELPAWSTYNKPMALDLHLDDGPKWLSLSHQDEGWLTSVLSALYEFPRDRVVAKRDVHVPVELLTLRIWDQQWPRLRRSFRFCTFTTKDRSSGGGAFDLQVVPAMAAGNRIRLPGTYEAPSVADHGQPDWLTTLMDDARHPNLSGLRDTLKNLGADILGGREAMPTLCAFHRLTSGSGSPSEMHSAINMLALPSLLSTSDMARAQVANYVLSSVEEADPLAIAFLWDNWQYIGVDRLEHRVDEVAGPLWRASPLQLLSALHDQASEAFGWAVQVVKAVPVEELLEHWPEEGVNLGELLAVRPDLLGIPAFWSVADVRSPTDLEGIDLSDQAVGALLRGMEREMSMRAAVKLLEPLRILNVLQSRSQAMSWDISDLRWVQHCVWDAGAVALFLSRAEAPSVPLLLEFTARISPDAVPNHYGDDPWYTALLKVKDQTRLLPDRLAAYGFARAIGFSSRNVAELLQMTFEQLHLVVANSTVNDSDWQLIEPRLPWVAEDLRWNRGWRLRNVVVSAFMDRRLGARSFAWIATNNELFITVMEEVIDRWGGRRFLKSVAGSLEDADDVPTLARRELIHSFVRSLGQL